MQLESLESLLSQALKHAAKGRTLKADLCASTVHQRIESTYGNPCNWRSGVLVEIIHRGPEGELSNLGLFQELFYLRTESRKLCRFVGDSTGMASRVEFVEGAHWVGTVKKPFHQFEETPHELAALQARFDELIEELTDELPPLSVGHLA